MREEEELIGKAYKLLDDAEKALEADTTLGTVQNRIYYACFHAAKAAVVHLGEDPRSHQGVKTLFNRELVREGKVDEEWGSFYSRMETYREQADYRIEVDLEREQVTDYLQKARKFIGTVEALLESDE